MNLGLDYFERVLQTRSQSIWRWLQCQPKLLCSLILLVLYLALGLLLETVVADAASPTPNVQPWDPASGLHVLLLFGFGFRYAPAIFLVPFLEDALWAPIEQTSYFYEMLSALYICLGYSGAAFFLLHRRKIDPRLSSLKDMIWFTTVFLGASFVVSGLSFLTQQVVVASSGSDWFQQWMQDWAGEANGILVLTPPCLILMRSLPWSHRRLTLRKTPPLNLVAWLRQNPVERAMLVGSMVLFAWLSYGGLQGDSTDFSYLAFIPTVWIAIRYGFRRTTLCLLILNVAAVTFAGSRATSGEVLAIQLGLLTVTTVGALLGAYTSDHQTERDRRQQLENELRYQANHDSLTGLYSRTFLRQQLEKIANHQEKNLANKAALFFIDIDRFKDINDSLGHLVGDRLLRLAAGRIRSYVSDRFGSTAFACRFGGDEFVVLIGPKTVTQTTQQTAEIVAQSLCDRLAEVYEVDDYRLQTTASIGIAFSDSVQTSSDDLLRNADIALYKAKAAGKGQYVVFDSRMYEELVTRSQLESDLTEAVFLLEDHSPSSDA